ncbi:unnamed protein product [Fraxinus pennsylvanica]|uniref:Prefoldin subunit 2 n=1 Tax=Fraxinus pennsylvanica TaxID=56036 RepID=A0AAD2DZ20_9LAMI|nr:unnamed protein product [Fraxinus pennsylvanica]
MNVNDAASIVGGAPRWHNDCGCPAPSHTKTVIYDYQLLLHHQIGSIMVKAERDGKEPMNEQAVANIYGAMRAEINQIYSKITELEMEVSEHSLVINAIKPLDPSRRCYRMIGGVLVERTIKEVLPAVRRNKEGIEEVITRLNDALEKKKKEVTEFESKYKIRIKKTDGEMKDESGKKEGNAQGVLVGPASGSE